MPKMSNVELLYQQQQPVLLIKAKTDLSKLPHVIGASFGQLAEYLAEQGLLLTDVPYVMYHDYQNIDERQIELEIGFPVHKIIQGKGNITSGFIPEGKIIFAMYRGNYAQITPLYDEMANWIKEHGYRVKGPCYEYYFNGQEFAEDELLTKVVIPVE